MGTEKKNESDAIGMLMRGIEIEDALKLKSNLEIAGMLTEFVWAKIPLGDPKSELVDAAIQRLLARPNDVGPDEVIEFPSTDSESRP